MNALWDFSFKNFFAPKFIGLLYAIGLGLIGLFSLLFLGLGFRSGILAGLLSLILTPVFALLEIIFLRIFLESMIAVIRVAEESIKIAASVKETAENTKTVTQGNEGF
ncbi:hypothetical protein KR51_00025000 [Rubidibacter lacunae KORDI 51-2]|uniref:DUF4282 domain-containing protein n=1 Tax=Rubidibacter lacunae KORDI 51-2 TaxID=582515 RepID=U5DH65_9CHRO|nr:DUF4282 domain-containing protein [Rubidibacter lacunae]ERN40941.1 hypothetical protein KR51_00025000 [Rubidibacter lacunae KORDI 51-2]